MYTIFEGRDLTKLMAGKVEQYPWGGEYRPEMLFKIGHEEDCLRVFLRCYEENPVVTDTRRNGRIWEDSCMELFISPSADVSAGYFNFEINAHPALLLHYGLDGEPSHRSPVEWPLEDFELTGQKGMDDFGRAYWQLSYRVPYALFNAYCPKEICLKKGDIIRANLYKCGNIDQPRHYGCWNYIDTTVHPAPTFHQPEYFGEMILE